MDYVHFNVLFAHLFAALSRSQSMAMFQINPCKHITVHDVVNSTFPAIKSTDNKPTPAVTPKTVGYIHALVINTLTFHSTEAPYARALIVQENVCGEFNELTTSAFQTELRDCLVYYYEKVCLMEGAGGLPSVRTNKRKFKPTAPIPDVVEEASQQVDKPTKPTRSTSSPHVRPRMVPAVRLQRQRRSLTWRLCLRLPGGERRRSLRQARSGEGPGRAVE